MIETAETNGDRLLPPERRIMTAETTGGNDGSQRTIVSNGGDFVEIYKQKRPAEKLRRRRSKNKLGVVHGWTLNLYR